MMRSMFSGVSSLRNHQIRMDVIGNNIANVNTVGYKADRVTFQEVFQQTLRAATAPTATRGGTNPMQVGLGMSIASIDTLHTESSLEMTGVTTDLAVEGNGFFVVSDGNRYYYTRAGLFDVDPTGHLVMRANGFRVQGWMANNGVIDTARQPEDLQIPLGLTIPARATTMITLGGNLDAQTSSSGTVRVLGTVRDSLGNAHEITFVFTRQEPQTANLWSWRAEIRLPDGTTFTYPGTQWLRFDSNGALILGNQQSITWNPGNGANQLSITVDFSALTQYALPNSAEVTGHDGRIAGSLETFTIDSAGIIRGVFTNGVIQELGQIALGIFSNPGGLAKVGNTMFEPTANSGDVRIGAPGSGGRGVIAPGSLEMSNVDLSQEFTNMIVTQRGFQASSRIISTADEMLQELVNLKR